MTVIKTLLLVGFGGFLGSIGRYGVGILALRLWSTAFPIGTILVNLTGSLLIGLLSGWLIKSSHLNWQLFLISGVCGGFTTFSAFSLDNLRLLKEHLYLSFLLYSGASILGGIFLCFIGFLVTYKVG